MAVADPSQSGVFEQEDPLLTILKQDLNPDGIKVHIGKENAYTEIQECSLIVSNFKTKGRNEGSIGFIGPRRMPYPKTISLIDYIAQILNEEICS